MCMRQNVFLFEEIAICTFFGAIWCKTECVLPLNGVRFGAKRKAKCRKIRDEKHKYPLQMV